MTYKRPVHIGLAFAIEGYKSWLYETHTGKRGQMRERREIADYLDENGIEWSVDDFGGRVLIFDDGHIEEAPDWDGNGDPPEPDDAYTDEEWKNCEIGLEYTDPRLVIIKTMFW